MSLAYEVVIGLEIHAQVKTKTKCFSRARQSYGATPNTEVTEYCLALPGTLPSLNKEVVRKALRTALAFDCEIQKRSLFARKQYFYPDMPKGYQISQYDRPIALGGKVVFYLDEQINEVPLERIHIEEDAGKSTHFGAHSLIDLNRAGTPLLEIVSKPAISSPSMAAAYAKMVRQVLRYNDICDGNLEEGSLRCDCNISLRKPGEDLLGTKVELKNLNSFRFIEKSLDYEIKRQSQMLDAGEAVIQETRLYDATKNKTFSMRKKEKENDYRYFPDPDLLPLVISESDLDQAKSQLTASPIERIQSYQSRFRLSFQESQLLASERELADLFEALNESIQDPRLVCNWLLGEFLRLINSQSLSIEERPIQDEHFVELVLLQKNKKVSGTMAKEIFEEMWVTKQGPKEIISQKGLRQIDDEQVICNQVDEVLAKHREKVAEYKQGKHQLYGFFVGQVMKAFKGQAAPDKVNQVLKERLK